jgi:hypothetical protein
MLRSISQQAKQVADLQQQVDHLPPNPFPLDLPARITGYNGSVCSWVEQTWDDDGNRIDHPAGLRGTYTDCPAIPRGNGTFSFSVYSGSGSGAGGVQVILRQCTMTADRGMVWEFQWHCSCGGYSGSGGI